MKKQLIKQIDELNDDELDEFHCTNGFFKLTENLN